MAPPRIFCPQPLQPGAVIDLESGPSQHLARALRKAAGDAITLFNGDGNVYPAEVVRVGRRQVTARVTAEENTDLESPLAIHLGIVISRGERMDWAVQKSTELGVTSISPLYSARGGVRLAGDRGGKKVQHWQQVAISACEQCGRNRVPHIRQPEELGDWLDTDATGLRLVLHHRAGAGLPARAPASTTLLVGPEGGLSPDEVAAAEQRGWQPLALGPRILRTETAPVAAIAILQARWGDM